MKWFGIPLCVLVSAACVSTPETTPTPVLGGYEVEEVRGAAREVLEDVRGGGVEVRVHENRVTATGRIGECGRHVTCGGSAGSPGNRIGTPRTNIDVRFAEREEGTAVEVEIDYETDDHCEDRVTCSPARLASTGVLEQEIIDRIRARLSGTT